MCGHGRGLCCRRILCLLLYLCSPEELNEQKKGRRRREIFCSVHEFVLCCCRVIPPRETSHHKHISIDGDLSMDYSRISLEWIWPGGQFFIFFFLVWFTIWMVRGKVISSANNSYMINTNWSGLYRMAYEVWQWVRRAKPTIYSIAQLKFRLNIRDCNW